MEEIWRDIAGYEGLYQVSSLGRVKSLDRTSLTPHPKNSKLFENYWRGVVLKPRITNGYCYACLWKHNKSKSVRVHRLVAQAFIPNPENLPCVNHLDGNKQNNKVSNLEWCTYHSNMVHSYSLGLHKCAKPVECILNGVVVKRYKSAKEAEHDGFCSVDISKCCRGERKTHGGYQWKFSI